MPKISVIVPVYNGAKYLCNCLNSILNQTYKDIEIIIVNDGSTDETQDIINEYTKKYPQKIKSFIKENGGLSEARNYGINKSTGEYISFVDADDYLYIKLFEDLSNEIEKNIDLIKFKLIKVDNMYREFERIDGPVFEENSGEDAFNKLVFKDVLLEPACIYLYKKNIFEENQFEFAKDRYHEDFGLIPLIIITSRKVSSKNVYGYYYLQSTDSITRNNDYNKTYKRAIDLIYHYDNMLKQIKEFNLKKETIQNLKQYYTNSILNSTKELNKQDRDAFILEIKRRKMQKNIYPRNLKQIIKKLILNINIKMYLKLT